MYDWLGPAALGCTCPAGHVLVGQQPPLPPPRWLHLFSGGPPPPPLLPPKVGMLALCPSWPRAATLPVWQAPYPGPLSWWPALSQPPSHLDSLPKIWLPQVKSPMALVPVQTSSLQWGGPPPCPPLCLPLLHWPPPAPPWASTPLTPMPHTGLEMTRCAYPPEERWWCTPQVQPPPHTIVRYTLHNLGTSSYHAIWAWHEARRSGARDHWYWAGLCPGIHLWAGKGASELQ